MSLLQLLFPNVTLDPKVVDRAVSALERIADSLERKYPKPPPDAFITSGRDKFKPSSVDDFSVYDDKQAERDYLDQLGETSPDTFEESPSFAMAHEEEFGGSDRGWPLDNEGEEVGIDPNGRGD